LAEKLIRNVGASFNDLGFGDVDKREVLEPVPQGNKSLEHPRKIEPLRGGRSGSGSRHVSYLQRVAQVAADSVMI
jgi:hypothetical protein